MNLLLSIKGFNLSVFSVVTVAYLELPVTSYVIPDHEPISCLQGRARCHGDVSCGVFLDTMKKVCDESSK